MKKLGTAGMGMALAALGSMSIPAVAQSHPRPLASLSNGYSGTGSISLLPNRDERRRHMLRDRDALGYGYGYDGLGYYSVSRSRHIGFFAEGGDAGVANGRAFYDYDRGYPYDHYAYQDEAEEIVHLPREQRCSTQFVRERGEPISVRVCRN